jgi:putative membrane protein insertion efficiency factor
VSPFARLAAGLVRGYQLIVSPWVTVSCKYYPSCSAYALEAVRTHGALRGLRLAGWRFLRCNPWSDGGVDHVPGHVAGHAAPSAAAHPHQTDLART